MLGQLRHDVDTTIGSLAAGVYLKKSHNVLFSDLTVDTTDGTQTINLDTALPVAAVPVKAQVTIGTAFVGLAAPVIDIGIAGGHELSQAFDSTQTPGRFCLAVPAAQYDGAQLTMKFTPATGKKLKTNSSAGSIQVDVYYFIAF